MSPNPAQPSSSCNGSKRIDVEGARRGELSGCLLARSGSILHRTPCFLLVVVLLITAHRLPAPIVEQPESPTPAPAEQESPTAKPKRTKTKAPSESSGNAEKPSTRASAPSAKSPAAAPHSRFAGIWKGKISVGVLGTTEETLIINSAGTIVSEKNLFAAATHPSTCDGTTVTFSAGALSEITFAVTPNSDGKTAIVKVTGPFQNSSAVFERRTNPP